MQQDNTSADVSMHVLLQENLWPALHHTCLKMHCQHKTPVEKAG